MRYYHPNHTGGSSSSSLPSRGTYLTPASSILARTSSGSWPITFAAYTPGTNLSNLCHFATQLVVGFAIVMTPSKTCEVHSTTASELPANWRKGSQLGHPSLWNFCDDQPSPYHKIWGNSILVVAWQLSIPYKLSDSYSGRDVRTCSTSWWIEKELFN